MNLRAMIRPAVIVGAIAVVASIPAGGDSVGSRFLASLRIAKPKTVTASAPAPGGARRLNEVAIGIMAETTAVATTEEDRPAPTADSASRVAGFRVKVLRARPDAPSVSVLGAQTVGARVNRGQLTTLLAEAGRRGADARVDPSIDGASVTLDGAARRPRPVRQLSRAGREHAPESDSGSAAAVYGQRELRDPHRGSDRDVRGAGGA